MFTFDGLNLNNPVLRYIPTPSGAGLLLQRSPVLPGRAAVAVAKCTGAARPDIRGGRMRGYLRWALLLWALPCAAQTIRIDAPPSTPPISSGRLRRSGPGSTACPTAPPTSSSRPPSSRNCTRPAGTGSPIARTPSCKLRPGTGIPSAPGASPKAGRIFHRRRRTGGADPPLLGLPLAPSRLHAMRHRNIGYSRLTDGDPATYWKSNPYLTQRFTGEADALHPQWVILDLAARRNSTPSASSGPNPMPRRYIVQFWTGRGPDPRPAAGSWQTFPSGTVNDGHGGRGAHWLLKMPVDAQFVRI